MTDQMELRERDVVREAIRLRTASPEKLAMALNDLNSYVISAAIAGIRLRNPGIKRAQLRKELKGIFAQNANY